jgi:Spy/CpxP family protein refolding chaperone
MYMHGTTRIFFAAATALTVAAATAHAQGTGTTVPAQSTGIVTCGPGTAHPNCADVPRPPSLLFSGIELTKAQQEAIDAIAARYRPLYSELRDQRQGERLTLPAYQAQFLGLRARERAEKRKLLSPDQLPRFDANADSVRKVDERLLAEVRRRTDEQHQGGAPRQP